MEAFPQVDGCLSGHSFAAVLNNRLASRGKEILQREAKFEATLDGFRSSLFAESLSQSLNFFYLFQGH
jgi:hypothetical protein